MGFAKEIEDFLNGYKMTTDMAGDAEDRKTRRAAADRAAAKDEQDEMASLAADPEAYLSPSQLASAKRAPKTPKVTSAIPTANELQLNSPYGDNPGEEEGVAMAQGGLVPDPDEEQPIGGPMGIPMEPVRNPVDNPVAAKARAEGKTSYSAGNQRRSLVAMNGKARNTYADEGVEKPTGGSTGPGLKDIFASSQKAIKAAMQGFAADAGQKKQAIGGAEPDIDFTTGKGAATPAEIKAIDAKIDPDGTMSSWDKGRARLGYAYNYFIERGEPEQAANVSKRILLFDKMASEARGKIAMQLINGGDPNKGASVLVDAYNDNIHDGSTLDVKPLGNGQFSFSISKDGNVVNEGTGTAAQLAELAGNVANGSEFTRRTARVAAAGDVPDAGAVPAEEPAAGSAAASPPAVPDEAIPTEAPATGAQPAPDGAAAGDAAPAAEKPKGPRDISWAKKQYSYAASVVKAWEDEAAKNPTPENQARLKDAQIRLSEAEQDAIAIRLRDAGKNSDRGNIAIQFDKTLQEWMEAADPVEKLPGMPKDGLRGQPKPAAVAAPAEGVPATPATSGANTPAGGASYAGYKGGGTSWNAGDGQMVTGPQPGALKAVPPEILAQAKNALSSGKSRAAVIRMLLENGYNPTGL